MYHCLYYVPFQLYFQWILWTQNKKPVEILVSPFLTGTLWSGPPELQWQHEGQDVHRSRTRIFSAGRTFQKRFLVFNMCVHKKLGKLPLQISLPFFSPHTHVEVINTWIYTFSALVSQMSFIMPQPYLKGLDLSRIQQLH